MEVRKNIDIMPSLRNLVTHSAGEFLKQPSEPQEWKHFMRGQVNWNTHEELYGGHRNLVVKEKNSDITTIHWRISEIRWSQIIRGILLEDTMSRDFGIPGRQLVNPEEPVLVTPQGFYVTNMHYVPGENRYPWTPSEIASSARMMGRLHAGLASVSFDPKERETRQNGHQWLHLDLARGNVLYNPGSAHAGAVIDYENIFVGPREMDLGRTASLLLVDSQTDYGKKPAPDDRERLHPIFEERLATLLENYPMARNADEAIVWAASFLITEDYGDLNHVRSMALNWLTHRFKIDQNQLVDTDLASKPVA